MTICPLWVCLPEIIVTVEDIRVVDGHHFVAANFDGQLLHDGAAQILNHSPVGIFGVIVKASIAVPGTITSSLPRLGIRTGSFWVWSMLLGLLVMTTDCRTPLTLKGSRRERYELSLRPKLLEAMMY